MPRHSSAMMESERLGTPWGNSRVRRGGETAAEKDAQRKKPKLPVHAIATANNPIIRFIGTKDSDYNQQYYQAWLPKLQQWCEQGKTPYFFVHTPANQVAPLHAQNLHSQLSNLPGWQPLAKTLQSKNQLAMF